VGEGTENLLYRLSGIVAQHGNGNMKQHGISAYGENGVQAVDDMKRYPRFLHEWFLFGNERLQFIVQIERYQFRLRWSRKESDVSDHFVGAFDLGNDHPQLAAVFGMLDVPEQQLRTPSDNRQRIIDLMPGTGGKFCQCIQFLLFKVVHWLMFAYPKSRKYTGTMLLWETVRHTHFAKVGNELTYSTKLYVHGIVHGFHIGYAADMIEATKQSRAITRKNTFRLNKSAAATNANDQSGANQNIQRNAEVIPP
jgi:hypothetical protein